MFLFGGRVSILKIPGTQAAVVVQIHSNFNGNASNLSFRQLKACSYGGRAPSVAILGLQQLKRTPAALRKRF